MTLKLDASVHGDRGQQHPVMRGADRLVHAAMPSTDQQLDRPVPIEFRGLCRFNAGAHSVACKNDVVHPTSVTVAIPVGDLAAAIAWYDAVLDRRPAIEPAPGIVEYDFAGIIWIQLTRHWHDHR